MIWIIIGLFGLMSVTFLMGKGGFLIAGYNTANEQQKMMYDQKKLCRVMGIATSIVTISLLIAEFWEAFSSYMIFGIIISLVVVFVGTHTYAKKKDNDFIVSETKTKAWYQNAQFYKIIISGIVLVGVTVMLFTGSVSIELQEDSLVAKSFMAASATVAYQDIQSIEYQQDIQLGSRTWGVGSFQIQAGNFKNDKFGRYKLYSYANCHDYIVLKTNDGYIVFNDSNEEKTKKLYQELLQVME